MVIRIVFVMFCITGKRCTKQEKIVVEYFCFVETDCKNGKRPVWMYNGHMTVTDN